MSRGEVDTRAFTDVDNTPHDGHAAAVCSAVATCTTRVPAASRSTRSTCTPGSPNNNVVPSDTALGSLLQSESVATSDFGRPRASSCNDTPYESEITTAPLKLKSRHTSGPRVARRRPSRIRCRAGPSRPEVELPQPKIEFRDLRFFQRHVIPLEIGARIAHGRAQE